MKLPRRLPKASVSESFLASSPSFIAWPRWSCISLDDANAINAESTALISLAKWSDPVLWTVWCTPSFVESVVCPWFRGLGGLDSVGGSHWSWLWCLGHVGNPGELPEPPIATLTGR